MRRDLRLKYSDIEARMRTTDSSDGRRPIYGSNTLTKRAQLFRQKAALIAWSGRKVDMQGNKDFVDALRMVENKPAQRARNLALPRDRTNDEVAKLQALTKRPGSNSKEANAAAEKAGCSVKDSTMARPSRKLAVSNADLLAYYTVDARSSERKSGTERAANRSASPVTQRRNTGSATKATSNAMNLAHPYRNCVHCYCFFDKTLPIDTFIPKQRRPSLLVIQTFRQVNSPNATT